MRRIISSRPKVLTLTDDAIAATIFLNIIHGHFHCVPKCLPIDDLHRLVCLTHRLGATPMLEPWADGWLAGVSRPGKADVARQVKMLWVCWELRCEGGFAQMARMLAMHSGRTELRDVFRESGVAMPPDIVERIRAIRFQAIGRTLSAVDNLVRTLIVAEHPGHRHNAQWVSSRKHDSKVLSSLISRLMGADLWPLPDAHGVQESPVELQARIHEVVVYGLGGECEEGNPGLGMMDEVERIMGEGADPMGSYRGHFQEEDKW
ncbi:hypothetical protein ACJ41O_005911 [Fusarium nematophilum]